MLPLGRLAESNDIARADVLAASDAATFVNDTTMAVEGGEIYRADATAATPEGAWSAERSSEILEIERTTERVVMEHHTADLGGLRLHYVEAGAGEPVLLWHGFLGSWYSWRRLIPLLATRGYRVIAPDMRGYGDSDKPPTGYDALALARDFRSLAEHLGLERHHVVSHDMGAPPALVYAAEWPDAVRDLVWIEEPVPGFGSREILAFGPETAREGGLWWWYFNLVPDLPEALIAGKERDFLSYFYRKYCYDPTAIGPEDVDEYLRTFAGPGGVRGALGVYRAIFETETQIRERFEGEKLGLPVLALGGEASMGAHAAEMVSRVAQNVIGDTVRRSGHFIPEERPEDLAERLLSFFSGDPLRTGGKAPRPQGNEGRRA